MQLRLGLPETSSTAIYEAVTVDFSTCRKLSTLLQSQSIPQDREDHSPTWMAPHDLGNFYLLLVAICHQTSPRGHAAIEGEVDGRHVRGWDYLSAKLESAARQDPGILSPESWTRLTAEQLGRLFRDDNLGDRLTDKTGRALLIQDLGRKMQERSWKYADELFAASGGCIAHGSCNLLNLLNEFRAYQDPVRKKSFFFLALMHNAGLWNYTDPEQLGAPIDYHEVRGHLRIGTVQIHDPNLRASLIEGREVTAEQDIQIRKAVHDAMMFISECSGLRNPSQLHYMFWNIFRSCCAREHQHCYACPPACSLPARYVHLATFPDGTRRCAFSSICQSVGEEPKLLDHIIDTEYY